MSFTVYPNGIVTSNSYHGNTRIGSDGQMRLDNNYPSNGMIYARQFGIQQRQNTSNFQNYVYPEDIMYNQMQIYAAQPPPMYPSYVSPYPNVTLPGFYLPQ